MDYKTTEKWECVYKMEGAKMVASNPTELVTQLRQYAFDLPRTNKEHRQRSYVWFNNIHGIQINVSTDKTFVNDLIAYGYVKILGCSQKSVKSTKNN